MPIYEYVCKDCEKPFEALVYGSEKASCPHCGSQEPSGPHLLSPQEIRRHRIEQRNDRTLALAVVGCAAAGAFYGIVMSASQIGAVLAGCGYAFVGMVIGVGVGFVINMTRNL